MSRGLLVPNCESVACGVTRKQCELTETNLSRTWNGTTQFKNFYPSNSQGRKNDGLTEGHGWRTGTVGSGVPNRIMHPLATASLLLPSLLSPHCPTCAASRQRISILSMEVHENESSGPVQVLVQPADPDPMDRLMEVVTTSGSGAYGIMFGCVVIVALHSLMAFGTLTGIFLDSSIARDLALPVELVALSKSLVFFGWIPGALLGGPAGDRLGRKRAAVLFSLVASVGLLATGLTPAGSCAALLGSRALTGIGIGGMYAPSFTLLVESSDPNRKGSIATTWTWGYVAGVAILCGLHYGTSALLSWDWRAEMLLLGAWGVTFALVTQMLVTESPKYLIASGATTEGLDSARCDLP